MTATTVKMPRPIAVKPADFGIAIIFSDVLANVHRDYRRNNKGLNARRLGRETASATATHALTLGAPYGHSTPVCGFLKTRVRERSRLRVSDDVQDTRTGGGKEDEESDVEEDSDDGAAQLRDKLVLRFRAQQVPRLQVARHVRRLRCRTRGHDAGREVHCLRGLEREARALADAAEDELGRLRDGGDGVDVGRAGGLDADEGEGEAEDEREERLADVHAEERREDRAAEDDAEEQAARPPERRDAVFLGGLIFVVLIVAEVLPPGTGVEAGVA